MRFVWGTILLLIGLYFVIRTDVILRVNGRVAWAEYHLRTYGGTRMFYKLIGVGFILIAFLLYSNLAGIFFLWAISPLTNVIVF